MSPHNCLCSDNPTSLPQFQLFLSSGLPLSKSRLSFSLPVSSILEPGTKLEEKCCEAQASDENYRRIISRFPVYGPTVVTATWLEFYFCAVNSLVIGNPPIIVCVCVCISTFFYTLYTIWSHRRPLFKMSSNHKNTKIYIYTSII